MKIQSGESYITFDGRSTGILKLNPGSAINYPYYSPNLMIAYSDEGQSDDSDSNLKIIEPEYRAQMVIESTNGPNTEIARLRDENEAMRVCIRQNVKCFMEMQKIMKSVEHKLPKELKEYLNQ